MPTFEVIVPRQVRPLVDQLAGQRAGYFLVRQSLADAIAQLQVLDLPPDFKEAFNDANAYAERLAEERTQVPSQVASTTEASRRPSSGLNVMPPRRTGAPRQQAH